MRHAPVAAAVSIAVALTAVALSSASAHQPAAAAPTDRPNVVLILLDDATVRDVEAMPAIQSLIADEGTTFTSAYAPQPLCCPARATLLTGLYPHNHRVLDNVAPLGGYTVFDDSNTIATYLDADYRTGLFGKYLNDNEGQVGYIPPGWDAFTMPGPRSTYRFVDPVLWVNGSKHFYGGESTDIYMEQAEDFMARSASANKAFFAYVSIVAPHVGEPHDDYPDEPKLTTWVPPEFRYTVARTGVDDPSVNEADVSDKPAAIANKPRLTANELDDIAERDAQRTESLRAVDNDVAELIDHLADLGVLDDTYVVVASDNGVMQGQHRIENGKNRPYEPTAHIPLIIRGPGFPAGSTYGRVTGLQDVAPTVLSLAGERPSTPLDGVSLVDLVSGARRPSNRPLLIELPTTAHVSDNAVQGGATVSPAEARRLEPVSWYIRGFVASNGLKYLEHPRTGEVELYDLDSDPYELSNLAQDDDWSGKLDQMSQRLHAWWRCDGRECR